MKRLKIMAMAATLGIAAAAPAYAALAVGAKAPGFEAKGAEAGKEIRFSLAEQLKKGPVVLYFYPKANTGGCDLEAKLFGEAMADFTAAGASVVGASGDDVATLKVYSTEKCASKFPVLAADKATIDAYDVNLGAIGAVLGGARSNRTTFVIAPDGKVLLSYTAGAPTEHPVKSLEAVKAWQRGRP